MRNLRKLALIAADNLTVRVRLARNLQSAGFNFELASSCQRALELASKHHFDIAIVMLSSTLPVTVVEELRERSSRILLLTETPNQIGELKYPSRADAVLPISASDESLLDQLTRLMTTANNAGPSSTITLRNSRIDLSAYVFIDANGRETHLTAAETALLKELARELGQTRSRDELRQAIAGRGLDRFERSVDMLVARLRSKLEPDSRAPQFILTVPRVGYKLTDVAIKHTLAKDAQRHQLTILSCHIANWRSFAFGLDPEDLTEISRTFRATADTIITRTGGTIFGQKAEALLAYFCYPQSGESDAEFAVQAALNILQKIDTLRGITKEEPQVKIAIATGVVVISGIEPIGEPVDVSIAMRDTAPSNSVIVDVNTRKLIDSAFTFEALEPQSLPELRKPISRFRVVAEHRGETRVSPTFARRGLIGRDRELQQLFRLWERAKRWQGQVAVVSGDAGIGKSHLCEAFIECISNESHQVVRYQCTPLLRNTPLHPFIARIEQDLWHNKRRHICRQSGEVAIGSVAKSGSSVG
jgi:DNA-binding response OmpR family regulator/class 3 adenylate cyclase